MRTKDHLALGYYLLQTTDSDTLHRHAKVFLLGCVEPDYNIATYMRGMLHHKHFYGHNAENSFAHVSKCMDAFEQDGLRASWDYFTLGTMLHYVADAFTYPHNEFWNGSLIAHVAYEKRLHKLFEEELETSKSKVMTDVPDSPLLYFIDTHKKYDGSSRKMKTDCRYIIETCEAMLCGSLQYAISPENEKKEEKGRTAYESAYHNGLVQAGH